MSSAAPVPPNASALLSLIQNTILAMEPPPSSAAAHCTAVATGP
jgi:hypothetical protein